MFQMDKVTNTVIRLGCRVPRPEHVMRQSNSASATLATQAGTVELVKVNCFPRMIKKRAYRCAVIPRLDIYLF